MQKIKIGIEVKAPAFNEDPQTLMLFNVAGFTGFTATRSRFETLTLAFQTKKTPEQISESIQRIMLTRFHDIDLHSIHDANTGQVLFSK